MRSPFLGAHLAAREPSRGPELQGTRYSSDSFEKEEQEENYDEEEG